MGELGREVEEDGEDVAFEAGTLGSESRLGGEALVQCEVSVWRQGSMRSESNHLWFRPHIGVENYQPALASTNPTAPNQSNLRHNPC